MIKLNILETIIIAIAILAILASGLLPLNYAFVTALGLIGLDWALLLYYEYRIRKK